MSLYKQMLECEEIFKEDWKSEAVESKVKQAHYTQLAAQGAEPFQVLKAWLTPEEYRGYMKGSAIVYLAREALKNGDEDIEKAIHHLQRLMGDDI